MEIQTFYKIFKISSPLFQFLNFYLKFVFSDSETPFLQTLIKIREYVEFFPNLGSFFNFSILTTTFIPERDAGSGSVPARNELLTETRRDK